MVSRRRLLIALGANLLSAPLPSIAQQQGKVWRIGVLMENETSYYPAHVAAFKAGLRELGYLEAKDYVVEQRSAKTDLNLLEPMAAELLTAKVDIILSTGTPSALALHKVTRNVPILIASAGDPVGSGIAVSLARPGGNVTGLTGQTTELVSKRLDLLLQLQPGIRRVGFLHNPNNRSDALGFKQFESDCAKLRIAPIAAPLSKVEEITATFNALRRDNAQGLLVTQRRVEQCLAGPHHRACLKISPAGNLWNLFHD